jgi:hypothetical protein
MSETSVEMKTCASLARAYSACGRPNAYSHRGRGFAIGCSEFESGKAAPAQEFAIVVVDRVLGRAMPRWSDDVRFA